MMKLRRVRRPSPAMVVACLALFVAIGGTAIAAKPLLTGTDIQDSSLQGVDIQDDSLTGDDLVESTLAKVPSAGDADTLGGRTLAEVTAGTPFTKVSVPVTTGPPAQVADVVTTAGFGTLSVTCWTGGSPFLRHLYYQLANTTSGSDRAVVSVGTPWLDSDQDQYVFPGASTQPREFGSGGVLYLRRSNRGYVPAGTATTDAAAYEVTVGPDSNDDSKCTVFVRKTTP